MKKVALVFVLAVLVPSLLLAWLAVRSLRDQQFLLERQQSLLDQRITDTLAENISGYLVQQQQEFGAQVESLAAAGDAQKLATQFDDQLRQHWPLADVGFCVTAAGKILSPLPNARPAAQMFRLDNSGFLGNREPVEVYLAANNANAAYNSGAANSSWLNNSMNAARGQANQSSRAFGGYANNAVAPAAQQPQQPEIQPDVATAPPSSPTFVVNNGAGEGGGAVGGAGSLNDHIPVQSASTANLAYADSAAPPQWKDKSIPATASTVPSPAAKSARPQPDSFEPLVAKNPSPSQTGPAPDGRNAFFIPQGGMKSQPQLGNLKPSGRANVSNSFAAGRASFFGGAGNTGAFNDSYPAPSGTPAAPTVTTPNIVGEPAQQSKKTEEPNLSPSATNATGGQSPATGESSVVQAVPPPSPSQNTLNYKAAQSRKVSPQSQKFLVPEKSVAENTADDSQDNLSKVVPAEAEFRQLIGDQADGMLARFLQNKLKLMCWHRLSTQPDLIFGAQLNLDRVVDGLRGIVQSGHSLGDDVCLAVLDDNARPVLLSRDKFQANWKRPFVATEIGDALPHWEVGAYLINPAQLTQAAQTAKLILGLLIAVLVVAIGIGSLLIVRGLEAELKLARQKTDFVSNVSHELKTPLTSIRMFSELLAEGRVADPAKQHSYLQIITAEAGRLTRLINNVLDFSRMERDEKKYNFQPCDLTDIVRTAAETFRPHLEGAGFQFACELPAAPIPARGDADALSQIIVNLLSNAEKYSGQPDRQTSVGGDKDLAGTNEPGRETGAPAKEVLLQLAQKQTPLPHAEIRVLDRGPGVPRGSEEKIFEKFYRAHDSLSSGVQGSGLGLTIARQIARAHGGDVVYEPRAGGGSCFILRLPIQTS